MTTDNSLTEYTDLDALLPKPKRIHINGVSYNLRETTVGDFIANAQLVEDLGPNPAPLKEMEATITVLLRTIEGMDRETLLKFTIDQLVGLREVAAGRNGTKKAEVAANDAAAANPQSAEA